MEQGTSNDEVKEGRNTPERYRLVIDECQCWCCLAWLSIRLIANITSLAANERRRVQFGDPVELQYHFE